MSKETEAGCGAVGAPVQPSVRLDPERAAFERYFAESRKSKGPSRRPTFERLGDGTYADDPTQRHWWTWQQAQAAGREQHAGWFALVMNAAAALEDAANCLRDPDAKRAAEGAAKHYREAANAMWAACVGPNVPGKPALGARLDAGVSRLVDERASAPHAPTPGRTAQFAAAHQEAQTR